MEGQEVARGSGILLAVSSLPSEYGIGTLGDAAFHFVDLLVDLKQKYWQVLPVGPTSFGDSPYQSLSAFAGNPYLIDLDQLVREKLLTPEEIQSYYWGTQKSAIDYAALFENRTLVLQKAFGRFDEHEPEFQQFVEENRDWVEDYGLYMALKVSNGNQNWQSWSEDIQKKQPVALAKCRKEMYNNIMFWVFCQYKFFQQWGKLREYANSKGIQLIGDVPFYVGKYDKRVFSEDDVKSLDTMLEKGKVSFPFDNGWYLASFYAANGCTIFGDGTDASKGYDFGGDNAVAVTKYIVDLFNNKNFVMDNNDGSLGLAGLKDGSVNAYFNGNWNYDAVVKNLGEENVGVAALPTINVDGKDCQLKAFLGSKAIGVNPNCKNQEVAVKLAAYLGSEDAQLKHFELRKQAPVNTTLASNEEVAKDAVAAAMANVATNCSIAQPIIPMQAYWDAATPFGDAFVHGAEGQITADNAKEKTEAFNEQLNSSLTE